MPVLEPLIHHSYLKKYRVVEIHSVTQELKMSIFVLIDPHEQVTESKWELLVAWMVPYSALDLCIY